MDNKVAPPSIPGMPPVDKGAVAPVDLVNMLAGQIVTPLQNIVVRLGQILQSMGGVSGFYAIKEIAFADSPYTTLDTDEYLLVDATAGDVVINLSANGNPQISAKKVDASGNDMTLVGTIDGTANRTTTVQFTVYRVKRDDAGDWWLF